MNDEFIPQLAKDEKVLWTGQPETSVMFKVIDLLLVPVSLLCGSFTVFWETMVLSESYKAEDPIASVAIFMFAMLGIPFVIFGQYMIFGRFFYKKNKKKRTHYTVTNKRVVTITERKSGIGHNMIFKFINNIDRIYKSTRSDGIGTLQFGNISMMESTYGNTGVENLCLFYDQDVPIFYDIKDAEKVYDICMSLKQS